MSLASQFQTAYPEYSGLAMREDGDSLTLGAAGSETEINLRLSEEEWIVTVREGHGHFETLEEALEVAAGLLGSTVRVCEEYRGDDLSQTWLEFRHQDGSFEVGERAVFLSPFDPEDWVIRPGEQWQQIRTTRAYDPAVGIVSTRFEIVVDGPAEGSNSLQEWLVNGLGPPQQGMRWIVSGHGKFVLQAPIGWRMVRSKSKDGFEDYAPEQIGLVFRLAAYFRESETPQAVVPGAARRPLDIQSEFSDASEWQEYRWTVHFSDGEEEMLGVVHLYFLEETAEEAEGIRQRIDGAVSQSLMVPSGWDCKTIADN